MTAETRLRKALIHDLDTCESKTRYQTGRGPVHEGWIVPDHLMLRLRAALSATTPVFDHKWSEGEDDDGTCGNLCGIHITDHHFSEPVQ